MGWSRSTSWMLAPVGVLVWLSAYPGAVSAQTYRWTTERGEVHYSQGIDSVPLRHRGNAILLHEPAPPAASHAAAEAATPPGVGRITFTPGQPIMVTARLNGAGTANLMLDTGATRTLITPTVLTALGVSFRDAERGSLRGVTGDAKVLAVKLDTVEVGGAAYGPLMVVSHDAGFDMGRGDGLLGRDFLDHFTVTIDNAAGIVTLIPRR